MLGPWNMHTTSVWDMRPFKAKDTKLLLQTALVEYVKNGTDDETFARMIGKQRERYIIHHDWFSALQPDGYETKFALRAARVLKKRSFTKLLSTYDRTISFSPRNQWWGECYANTSKAEHFRNKFWTTPGSGQSCDNGLLHLLQMLNQSNSRSYA